MPFPFLLREIPLVVDVKLDWRYDFSLLFLFYTAFDLFIKSEWELCWVVYSWFEVPPLHHLKYILPLLSGLQNFCWKISCYPYGDSLIYNLFLFPFASIFFFEFLSVWLVCILLYFFMDLLCMELSVLFPHEWVSFPIFGKFSLIISSNIFSGPFSLSSPSGVLMMWMLVHLKLSQRSLRLSSVFLHSFFFILFCSSDFYHSVFCLTYVFLCLC